MHIGFVPLIAALQLFLKGFDSRGRQESFQTPFASTHVSYEKVDSPYHAGIFLWPCKKRVESTQLLPTSVHDETILRNEVNYYDILVLA